jgi:hypothetical protein
MFLDELPEFDRACSKPCANRWKAGASISPAPRGRPISRREFQLIAAMNPCPCGFHGHTQQGKCRCTPDQVARYRGKLSGPLLDRIDLLIEVPALPAEALQGGRRRVVGDVRAARQRARPTARAPEQAERPPEYQGNRHPLPARRSRRHLLKQAVTRLDLSARAWHRMLKVARTIADLAGSDAILRPTHRRGHPVPPFHQGDLQPTRTLSHARHAILLAALSALGPFSIDTYLPSFQDIGASSQRDAARSAADAHRLPAPVRRHDALARRHRRPLRPAPRHPRLALACSPRLGRLRLRHAHRASLVLARMQGITAGAGIVVSRAIVRDLLRRRRRAAPDVAHHHDVRPGPGHRAGDRRLAAAPGSAGARFSPSSSPRP